MIGRPDGYRKWGAKWRRVGSPPADVASLSVVDGDASSSPTASPAAPSATAMPATVGLAAVEQTRLQRELLGAAAAGDPEAVRWLLDEVAPVVYGFVFARVGGDQGVAEDLLQETLLEAVRSAPSFRGEAAASTWMCAIARRRLARHYESERRAEVARQSLRLVASGVAGDDAGESDMIERQDEVVRALGRLPALQRQVLVLKYLEGMSVHDIAGQVNRSRVQVQSLLQRGRDGLRRQLGDQGA